MTSEATPGYPVESVERALRILLMLRSTSVVRVTDVSRELGVSRSTAHRLLATLCQHGFVSQDRLTKAYRAGRVFIELGLATVGDLDVRRKARQHLVELAALVRETVNLLVLEGAGSRFIDGVEGDRLLRVTLRTGTLLPASTTSGGRVLLAELPGAEVRALYPHGLPRLTDHTITDFVAFERELELVRRRGYAVNRGESDPDLTALAVPIRDHIGRAVAALAISSLASRMGPDQLPAMVDAARRHAARIEADLA
jgi:DNA-binding IclR family transcriptional regulator